MQMQHVAHAKIYDVTLPANGSLVLPVGGEEFTIVSATGNVHVDGDGFGALGVLKAGQGLRRRFTRLTLTDRSGSINTLQIVVAGSDFIDKRIAGEVSVIDGARSRTLAGDEFVGRIRVAAAAATFNAVQWLNPAGSGVRMVIQDIWAQTPAAPAATEGVQICSLAAVAYANVYAIASPKNKRPGYGATAIQQRYQTGATLAAAKDATAIVLGNLMAGTHLQMATPVIIEPGSSFVIAGEDVNVVLLAQIGYREEVIV